MVTVAEKQNVYLSRVKHTVFVVRVNGLFVGEFSAKGWNASDAVCLSHYNAFKE